MSSCTIFAGFMPAAMKGKRLLPEEGIEQYLQSCLSRMGSAYFQTPRDTIKDFISLLNVLPDQNRFCRVGGGISFKESRPRTSLTVDASVSAATADEDLASFKL